MKKILIMLPGLVATGGIHVVIPLIKVLHEMQYEAEILSREEGEMRTAFERLNVKVSVAPDLLKDDTIDEIAEKYDEILVNTLQLFGAIYKLNKKNVPVKWWIHEPPLFFESYHQGVPQELWDGLAENIKVLSAGRLVHDYLQNTYRYNSEIFNFAVEDTAGMTDKSAIRKTGKIRFLLPSVMIQPIKGQDLFLMAIEMLPESYRKRAEFVLIGTEVESSREYYEQIKHAVDEIPEAELLDRMSHEELLQQMKSADCIVAPSREDATNACIVEGMMLSKVCICSEGTGVSYYMKDCVDGFVFQNCNAAELTDRIMLVIDNANRLEVLAQNGRKVYETVFSMERMKERAEEIFGSEKVFGGEDGQA